MYAFYIGNNIAYTFSRHSAHQYDANQYNATKNRGSMSYNEILSYITKNISYINIHHIMLYSAK